MKTFTSACKSGATAAWCLMTIPEACQLVLQAGAMARGGELFVLDMGTPVKIYDLAVALIQLSGLEPEKDIPIVFTGLRLGEKMFEELRISWEDMTRTANNEVLHIDDFNASFHETVFWRCSWKKSILP